MRWQGRTYPGARSIVWIVRRSSVPIIRYPLFARIPDKCIIWTGNCKEGLEYLPGEETVGTFGGMVGHEVDDKMMCDGRNKASEWLKGKLGKIFGMA